MPEGSHAGPDGAETCAGGRFKLSRLAASRYPAVFAGKRSFYGQTLVIWVARTPDAGRRAGVVVSKRAFRRAVDRNRAKRLMREAFRLSQAALAEGVELILVARAGMAGKRCADVREDFERVCRRARIWVPSRAEARRT